jgi:hypothetical protein
VGDQWPEEKEAERPAAAMGGGLTAWPRIS